MTLKIYLMQDSSGGGGFSHDDEERPEGTFDVCCPDWSSNEELDECRVHREAIAIESTFKIRSCDWRTSVVTWPVSGSICWRMKPHDNSFGFIQGSNSPLQGDPIIHYETKQSYPTNQWKAPPTSQLPDEFNHRLVKLHAMCVCVGDVLR